ncbi:CbiX/SirB N-terminal domain-containing protein [Sulfuracidifex tepidarius]|uniref:CbiX/SirB N-terminal domain-containing protein n=1 Tax=Sulfuracidifex tepidarius TaxID=1294262 RepID=UPI0006D0139D|nr:CbiX/SirB N-terminal domain-containing protein [Sulfuracidifex tepidarius]
MIGILLVLHGSKVPQWKEMAIGYAKMLSRDFELVEYGFLEFDQPDLRTALENLVEKGAEEVVVVPLLFATGTHFLKDIPRLLGIEGNEADIHGKKVLIRIAPPLGLDSRIAEVLKERVEETIRIRT